MGGGGAKTQNTQYESDRQGAASRSYGELSSTGFQSQEAYDTASAGIARYKGLNIADFTKEAQVSNGFDPEHAMAESFTKTVTDTAGFKAAQQEALTSSGLSYDPTYDRWTLANGVDYESAVADFDNYNLERQEIAEYEAKEERRKEAPDDLTGTQGQVDYTLAIEQDDSLGSTDNKKKKAAVDVNVNASSQSLGIAQDG